MDRVFESPQRFDIQDGSAKTPRALMNLMKKISGEWADQEIPYDDNKGYYVVNEKFAVKYVDPAVLCNSTALHKLSAFEDDVVAVR